MLGFRRTENPSRQDFVPLSDNFVVLVLVPDVWDFSEACSWVNHHDDLT